MKESDKLAYFCSFASSARAATLPGPEADNVVLLGAKVSLHVKSQTRLFPDFQGKSVMPSGRLPSCRETPGGSRTEGNPAEEKARLRRSLTWKATATLLAVKAVPAGGIHKTAANALVRLADLGP